MAYYSLQADFSKGQISPLLGARADVDFWRSSLFECLNFHVLTHGGLRRRSGTRFVAEVASSTALARIFPFKFSEEQSYVLAFNGGYIRFYAQRGVVGSPYQISHPYAESDLRRLSFEQFNDVAYIAHKQYRPRKLLRKGETDWEVAVATFNGGPYLADAAKGVTLTPAARGNVAISSTTSSTNTSTGFVEYTLASAMTVDAYWITATSNENIGDSPSGWTFEGWDGSAWVLLDTVEGESGWQRGSRRYFELQNEASFEKYRFNWTGPQYHTAELLRWGAIGMHQKAEEQTPFAMTASSVSGINDGAGFLASDVDRAIRLRGAGSRWQWARIISHVSSTQVMVQLYGHALTSTGPIASWMLGAFSDASGWPGSVSLFNERLMWARTDTEPVTVFGSRQGNFEEYGLSDPAQDTDGIKITLLSSGMNEILWLAGDEDLVTGSAGQIRTVGPADITKSFSAINVTQRKGPTSGSAHTEPLSIGGVSLYVGAGGTKIRELVMGEQNRYVAPELSLLGEQFFKTGIVEWAFAERPDPTIYCVMGNGELVGVTYDREQRVVGFARHVIAGGSVESVAVVPSPLPGYEDVYLVVRRTINGQAKRYVEVLERPFDGDIDTVHDAFHVDCGLSYDGSPITTVTGLGHLEGEDVAVLADGGVVDGLVVSGGSITLPYPASRISVGLRYKSRGVTLPVAGPQQDGTLLGRKRTIQGVSMDVLNSGAVMMGAYGGGDWTPRLYEQIYKTGDTLFGNAVQLQSGAVPCQIEGSWIEGDGKIVFETDHPLPLLIRSLSLQVEGEP